MQHHLTNVLILNKLNLMDITIDLYKIQGHIILTKPGGQHSSLWPDDITFKELQSSYLLPKSTKVCCGQRPQHLRHHREAIHSCFFVVKGHNI